MYSIKIYLKNLNIFDSSSTTTNENNEHERRSNIIATRLFFIILFVILLITGIIFTVIIQVTHVTLKNPVKNQVKSLNEDAHCSCSRISISNGEFTTIQTRFHQICSSDFVTNRWIEAINSGSNVTYFYIRDFQLTGSAMFQALAGFCRLSKNTILQSITSFNQELFITPNVLSEHMFQSQINASINQLQSTISHKFLTEIELIQKMITNNYFLSGLQTNLIQYYLVSNNQQISMPILNIFFINVDGIRCSCSSRIDCQLSAMITNIFGEVNQLIVPNGASVLMHIPGFQHSCSPVDALLLSSFECLYDQTCINQLVSFFPTREKFTAIQKINVTRFQLNSITKTILKELMIEEWFTNVSYDKYYEQCAPLSCGLTLILGFILQNLVQYFRRPRNIQTITVSQRIRKFSNLILIELNLFNQHESNQQQIKYQRIGSQLYVILILISFLILSFYTLFIENIQQKTIINPSESEYNQLREIYSDSLFCPCSSVSMNYSMFMTIKSVYHQICSSDFVSDQWIIYTTNSIDRVYYILDYRFQGAHQFQFLSMFCQQAQQIVNNSLVKFLSSQAISSNFFELKINALISEWQDQTLNQFLRIIQLFQSISHGNQLISGKLNADTSIINSSNHIEILLKTYSNCSCGLSSSCVVPMGIFEFDTTVLQPTVTYFLIPNFYLGCSAMESLMKSTLECFYNRSCMLILDQYLSNSLGSSFSFTPLNRTINQPNETIESIVNRLMINHWLINISYSSYYQTCSPKSCSYEYTGRSHILFVITMIVGIFGGLSVGLHIIMLILIHCFEMIINHFSIQGFFLIVRNIFSFRTEKQMIQRIYFIFLSIILFSLFISFTQTLKSTTIEIIKPSFSNYKFLFKQYSDTLQCSCSQISIPYRTFLNITPRFHHLCSSKFISNEWIEYLYRQRNVKSSFQSTDYHLSAPGQFILLRSLCQLSQKTINETLLQLLNSYLIHSQLSSSNLLNETIRTIIHQFQLTTPTFFINTLNLIREITGSNMIMNGWSTNWIYRTEPLIYSWWTARTIPVVYEECDCGLSWQCTRVSRGMMAGCYPLEALFQTTLQCFYNQQCIDSNQNFTSLNLSTLETSQFQINSTIQSILNNLMVEEYLSELSYENYFDQCSPSSCTFFHRTNLDAIESIISLISLYGGLAILTKVLSIIIVKLYRNRNHRIYPQMNEANT